VKVNRQKGIKMPVQDGVMIRRQYKAHDQWRPNHMENTVEDNGDKVT